MSKLLDKLAELNRAPGNSEVPPDIRVKVARDDEVRSARKRYLLYGFIASCAVLAGIGIRLRYERSAGLQHNNQQISSPQVAAVAPLDNVSSAKPAAVKGKHGQPAIAPSMSTRTKPHHNRIDQPESETAKRIETDATPPVAATKGHDGILPEIHPPAPAIDKEALESVLFAARSAEKRKAYGEALRIYMNALKTDPDNHCLLNNAASIHIRLGEYGTALALCEKALLRHRDYIPALINQGIANNALGRTSEAAESFTQALALDPTHREAIFNLALFNEKTGKLDASANAYQRLAVSGDLEGMMGLARVYEKQSRKKEAVRIYVDVTSRRDIPADTRNAAIKRLRQLEE